MEESNVRVNKLKGQRKSKKVEPEPVEETIEQEQEDVVEPQPEPQPKKKTAKKPVVQEEEYDVENQLPDVVIHKRHKGAKPRKIIVITGDSDADSSDEEMPYRAKPKVEIKKRQPKIAPAPEPEPEPAPRKVAKPKKEIVSLVGGDPKNEPRDAGKGLPQSHAIKNPPQPKTFVVDSFIDSLLGLA
jgi:hypothetical protein